MAVTTKTTDVSKFPRQAQNEIEKLQRENKRLRRQLEHLAGSVPDSSVTVRDILTGTELPVPPECHVRFTFPGKYEKWIDVCWDRDGTLLVRGSYAFRMYPDSSNTMRFAVRKVADDD